MKIKLPSAEYLKRLSQVPCHCHFLDFLEQYEEVHDTKVDSKQPAVKGKGVDVREVK